MTRKPRLPEIACCLIEREDGFVLILRAEQPDTSRRWEFPRVSCRDRESPEAAARRAAEVVVELRVSVNQGQPPLTGNYEGRQVAYRYFLCDLDAGEPMLQPPFVEYRWVHRGQLCEYDFAEPDSDVVKWYAST